MFLPADPIAAATHPDPYGYYETLTIGRPIAYERGIGMWVAAGAEAVEAVLVCDDDRRLAQGVPVYRRSVNARVPRFTEEFP